MFSISVNVGYVLQNGKGKRIGDMNDEIVQYIVVNKELGMSTGKVSAQVAHVAMMMGIHYGMVDNDNDDFWFWYTCNEQKKIILQGKQKDLEKLTEKFFFVIDSGYTEIPKGSLTVVGLPPMRKSEAKQYIKRLQLYRD
ncbi:aminoacyl-tRNA hydrolase [Bacillus subtilis]|uniref:aminoacyl-tRNA hydrolase n=1 Tax=Bacillus subtilis TaxID=1423 RepID=UPI002ED0EF0A